MSKAPWTRVAQDIAIISMQNSREVLKQLVSKLNAEDISYLAARLQALTESLYKGV